MPTLKDANDLLKSGLNIIPLPYGEKGKPLVKSWKRLQSELITKQELSTAIGNKRCNLGIITGSLSNLIVVDCDNDAAVDWACKNLPKTHCVKTARGIHLYYRAPAHRVACETKKRGLPHGVCLDIKGDGGYIVAPGSYNANKEIFYTADETLTAELLSKLPIFQIDWFVDKSDKLEINERKIATRKTSKFRRAEAFVRSYPPAIEGEHGEPHTYELAKKLLWDFRITEDEALSLMLEWGQTCEPAWEIDQLKEKIDNAKKYSNPGSLADDPVDRLEFINSELFEVIPTKGAPILKKLANFEAKITKEENIFDGDSYEKEFHIEGRSLKKTFPSITISADLFPQMAWTTKNWGAEAIVSPGNGVKDKVRAAIQHNSRDAKSSIIYSHLGWNSGRNSKAFIHASGFLGQATDAEVRITNESLSNYHIETKCRWDLDAVECFLDMGPDFITFPLLAAAFRAPLNNWIKPDFSLFLTGSTGTRKSELSAMAQSFYGSAFTRTSLPANWSSTANALEKAAFLAKDCLLVIDDFTPTGTQSDIAKLNQSAERLFRGVGNSSGRARLNRNGALLNSFTPRSLIIASGEDIPKGHSLRARLLVINVDKSSVHLDLLSLVQKNASEGINVSIMHDYLMWLSKKTNSYFDKVNLYQAHQRAMFNRRDWHGRTADTLAGLKIGFMSLIDFLLDQVAISNEKAKKLEERLDSSLSYLGDQQMRIQENEDPCSKFISALVSGLLTERIHLDCLDGIVSTPLQASLEGEKIGWYKGDEIYLNPDAAYGQVTKILRDQGDSLKFTKPVMWKNLAANNLIKVPKEQKNLMKRKIHGNDLYVLVMDRALIEGKLPGSRTKAIEEASNVSNLK